MKVNPESRISRHSCGAWRASRSRSRSPRLRRCGRTGRTHAFQSPRTPLKTDGAVYSIKGRQVIEEKIRSRASAPSRWGTRHRRGARGARRIRAQGGAGRQEPHPEPGDRGRAELPVLYLSNCTSTIPVARSATEIEPGQGVPEFVIQFRHVAPLTQSGGEIAIQGCTRSRPSSCTAWRARRSNHLYQGGSPLAAAPSPRAGCKGAHHRRVSNLTVRHSTLAGEVTRLVDCATLTSTATTCAEDDRVPPVQAGRIRQVRAAQLRSVMRIVIFLAGAAEEDRGRGARQRWLAVARIRHDPQHADPGPRRRSGERVVVVRPRSSPSAGTRTRTD